MRLIHVALTAFVIATASGCRSSDSAGRAPIEPSKGASRILMGARPESSNAPTNAGSTATIVLPTSGRVHKVNAGLQFVVIDYTLGGMPPLHSDLHVYRAGERVGQVRLSGPARDGFVAADILEGFLQIDDEVRVH